MYREETEGFWTQRSRFWHPAMAEAPRIIMIDIYCDESHDGHTYALAGWIATPSAWDRFTPAWKEMLTRHPMPDGSPMPAFHAAEIVNRDEISDSRWRGWTFAQEKAAFIDAVDVITDRALCANMWAVGVSVAKPFDVVTPVGLVLAPSSEDETTWTALFTRLFLALVDSYKAQQGFSFMFDNKPEIREIVNRFYEPAKKLLDTHMPGKMAKDIIAFGCDEEHPPLQAADLFAYEWRRRITEKVTQPGKALRGSYRRIRECRRENNMLHHYDAAAVQAITQRAKAGVSFVDALHEQRTTED